MSWVSQTLFHSLVRSRTTRRSLSLQVLYDASPAAVGGKLPDDNFYYTEPSVLRKVMAAIRNSAK